MDFERRFDLELGIVRVRIVGAVNIDEIIGMLPGFLAHEDFVPGMPALFDLSEASMGETSVDQMRRAGQEQSRVADRRGQARVAVVTASDADFGMLRMYGVHAHDQCPHLEFAVFRDMEVAERWALGHLSTDAI